MFKEGVQNFTDCEQKWKLAYSGVLFRLFIYFLTWILDFYIIYDNP
jgi:hypothetical protein